MFINFFSNFNILSVDAVGQPICGPTQINNTWGFLKWYEKKGSSSRKKWFLFFSLRVKKKGQPPPPWVRRRERKARERETSRSWLEGDSKPDWDEILHTWSSRQALLIYQFRFQIFSSFGNTFPNPLLWQL